MERNNKGFGGMGDDMRREVSDKKNQAGDLREDASNAKNKAKKGAKSRMNDVKRKGKR